ncbi:MAG: hypothetical protein ACM30E_13410 [Nitrososphaerales archaeon]
MGTSQHGLTARWERDNGRRALVWIALALCLAVFTAWVVEQFVHSRPDYARAFAPDWLPVAAAVLATAGLVPAALMWLDGRPQLLRLQAGLSWAGLLLMVCAANGLPFDLLRIVGLIPLAVDWSGLVTRTFALAAVVVLARLLLAAPSDPASAGHGAPRRVASWYGYAAFLLALPYPVLRTCWALGGTIGLSWPGAAGSGFEPWLLAIPWLFAAALSLLLVQPRPWPPRRLLLAAGWFATAFVAMIGPAAFWSLVSAFVAGRDLNLNGIAAWVPALFYGSWFLWAIAGAAATRSYQLRSLAGPTSSPV